MDLSSELNSCLSGYDALRLLEIIQQSLTCDSEDVLVSLFPKLRDLVPFDFAVAILGHRENDGFVVTGGSDIGMPDEFAREYNSRKYLQEDLLVRKSLETRKLQYWPYDWEKLGQNKEIISLCMDFNMPEGYIHGSSSIVPAKNESIFCFSGLSLEHDSRNEAILELVMPHLHLALCQIFNNREAGGGYIALSAREREVLNWLSQGKSSWGMSVILGISESTVNYHVYNIMRKLEVTNRPQAVAAAVRLGLVELG